MKSTISPHIIILLKLKATQLLFPLNSYGSPAISRFSTRSENTSYRTTVRVVPLQQKTGGIFAGSSYTYSTSKGLMLSQMDQNCSSRFHLKVWSEKDDRSWVSRLSKFRCRQNLSASDFTSSPWFTLSAVSYIVAYILALAASDRSRRDSCIQSTIASTRRCILARLSFNSYSDPSENVTISSINY